MRILLINNFFRDVAGVERVLFVERALLVQHGHDVIDFSTQHIDNYPSPHAEFFVSGVDFNSPGNFFKKATRFFYSREVDKKLSALLEKTKPDVAHVHGIFDVLGPTVLYTLHKYKIKIVFTAHAYKLICPNWKLFSDGHIDEQCKHDPFHDAWNRSIQNSFLKSFGSALSWWWHTRRGIYNYIDQIISPSQFLIDKHVEFGWSCSKFVHIPNPFDITRSPQLAEEGGYILFVGRLVPEKGVDVLIRAARLAPEVPIIIIGDGPERERLMELARETGASHISFIGRKTPAEVHVYMASALAVVVPSIWYENDSIAVVEAQAIGKIVIGSYIGGIPEQIKHGKTGFLFEAGNPEALAQTVMQVLALTPQERLLLGNRARGMVDIIRQSEFYYEAVMTVLSH